MLNAPLNTYAYNGVVAQALIQRGAYMAIQDDREIADVVTFIRSGPQVATLRTTLNAPQPVPLTLIDGPH
jgi:hypothetical protein